MPSFEIVGIGRDDGKARTRVYKAADFDTAVRMASSDGTIVESNACRRVPETPSADEPEPSVKTGPAPTQSAEKTLFKGNPTMFRSSPVWFTLLLISMVGIPVLVVWWIRCKCSSLEVTTRRAIMRTGILAKTTNEVRHQDIRNIIVNQTFQQRIFGTGDLQISSAGQSDIEIEISGLKGPQKVADLIRSRQ
ncbi:MAG: PH domain-containing protein [Planctomycetes bacterium]|nr:PH domain-containing protein [Planctomycetota bacterium]